jgi:two-component system heavy metal sensor histidine kinase CusS
MTNKTKRPKSLVVNVTIRVGIIISLCFIVLGFAMQKSIHHHFLEQDADELHVIELTITSALNRAISHSDSELLSNTKLKAYLENTISGHHGVYFAVFDHSQQLLYQYGELDFKPLLENNQINKLVTPKTLYSWDTSDHNYWGSLLSTKIYVNDPQDTWVIAVAAQTDFHHSFMTTFFRSLWSLMALAGILTIFAAWFAVRNGHRPLHQISTDIKSITSEQLNRRLSTDNIPLELLELVEAFNTMITSMDGVFQKLSHFSADIAHELRTPITNLSTQTQVALNQARSQKEYQEILYSNLEEYNRLSTIVRDMLWLAKTDNNILILEKSELNIKKEVVNLFDYFEAWAEEQYISLNLQGDNKNIQADKSLLQRALSNLLSNAIRHASPNTAVTVVIENIENTVSITVKNIGSTISDEHIGRVFDRFYRIDPSRQRQFLNEGIGLGLSIVKSIVQAHKGTISVTSAEEITNFTIKLPNS